LFDGGQGLWDFNFSFRPEVEKNGGGDDQPENDANEAVANGGEVGLWSKPLEYAMKKAKPIFESGVGALRTPAATQAASADPKVTNYTLRVDALLPNARQEWAVTVLVGVC
jgi:hypothetical protein